MAKCTCFVLHGLLSEHFEGNSITLLSLFTSMSPHHHCPTVTLADPLTNFAAPECLPMCCQATARELKISMDGLKLATCWGGNPKSPVVAQIAGLLIQGCTFDGTRMTALLEDSPTFKGVPPMTLAWIPKASAYPYPKYALLSHLCCVVCVVTCMCVAVLAMLRLCMPLLRS
jgi:hypothetical protein